MWKYTGKIGVENLRLALAALRTNRDGRLFANPRIETEFSLKSGETAVIGGLAKTEHEDVDTGIPILSKIWGLRWLFGQRTRINRQREIVVLVTMGLVDPEQPDSKAGMPKNAFLSREYLDGTKKEPGDNTKEELEEKLDRARSLLR